MPNEAQGTGSGCSIWEPKPAWQHDAGCSGRTVADVSAVADDVAIYDSSPEIGGWGVVAGTSISSPIIASVYALAGNAKSVVYGSYPYSHQSSFFDITQGSNFTPDTLCGYLCTAESATTARRASARRTESAASSPPREREGRRRRRPSRRRVGATLTACGSLLPLLHAS